MHPNAKIRYKNSNLIHNIYSDALYLGATKAESCVAGTSSLDGYPKTSTQSNWMDPNMFSHPSYNLLMHLLLKQNLMLSLSTPKRVKSFISFLRKWVTPNHPNQFIVIIPLPLELEWHCQETMLKIHGKCYFWIADQVAQKHFTVDWNPFVKTILLITSLHMTQLHITPKSDLTISILMTP